MISGCDSRRLLSHVTLMSNWETTPTCLGYLWYLSLDWQLYLIAPILLLFINKKFNYGLCFIVGLMFISCLWRAIICRLNNVCNSSDVDIPVSFFVKILTFY